ncbi:MAG: hypothetical protein GWO24_09935, partial [Akkermansiaceae bacterium]|nr:hypothetical protein [Akkermansiaceae bacterium]
MPTDATAQERQYEAWAAHMATTGIPRDRAFQHFAEWADEDTYQPLEDEVEALRAIGFDVDVPFRRVATTVI